MKDNFKENMLLKIRREFTEKEKYNILMEDYFNMIKKLSHMQELQDKYNALREQHKNLQSRYTKLRNKYER
jgi:succinate dehydrogenase/fumarate reductase flavoprotein subunit